MNQKLILFALAMNVILPLEGHFALAAGKNVRPPGRTSVAATTTSAQTTQTMVVKKSTNRSRIDSSVFEEIPEMERSCESRYEGDECAILYCECLAEEGLDPDDPALHFRPTSHGDNCGTSHLAEEVADQISVARECQHESDECEDERMANF